MESKVNPITRKLEKTFAIEYSEDIVMRNREVIKWMKI